MCSALASKMPIPTGDPWVPSLHNPATVPIPWPVIIRGVEGPYTERDRKLFAFLVHAVWDELGEKPVHEMPVKDISYLFREVGSDHNAEWIWESAERLAKTAVEWIRTEGDKRYKGIGHLLSWAETDEEAKESGTLRFSFPEPLVPIFRDPRRFARLRTHFMMQLSGKYAVTLYELLESVANKENPVLEARIDDLRHWLKVPPGKMTRWQDFRRFAMEPALKQINDNPEGAGFTVRMKILKEGRAIQSVRFEVIKTKDREAIEAKLRDREKQLDMFEPRLRTDTFEKARHFAPGWDVYELDSQWRDWAKKKTAWPPKNPDAAFLGFCKQRGAYPGSR